MKTSSSAANDAFTAIAHPVRRAILDRLREGEHSVSSLAEPFDISRPAISQHLAVLNEAGLVTVEPRGRENLYHLQPEALFAVGEWISAYEVFWEDRLDRLGEALDRLEAGDET